MNRLPLDNFRSPAALARLLLTLLIGLSLDLWSKHAAFEKLALSVETDGVGRVHVLGRQPDVVVIPGILHLRVTTNQGAVFGAWQQRIALFIAVSVAAIAFLLYLFAHSDRRWFYQIILGMLLAGVLGNLYDRAALGYVRDMIYALPRWENLFPWIFNIADVLLCTGVFLIFVHSLFSSAGAPQKADAPST